MAELRQRFPAAHFLGTMNGPALASHMAAADVFVFPSRTDTFGVVQLEALADEIIEWNERSIADAIRRQARHEDTGRWDVIDFKLD